MQALKTDALKALGILLGNPRSDTELAIMAAVCLLTFLILFNKIAKLMSFPLGGLGLAAVAGVVLAAVTVGAAAAALKYVAPLAWVQKFHVLPYLPHAAGLLAVVLVVAPALRLIHRSRYVPSLVALLLGIAATGAVLVITHAIDGALRSGERNFERTRDRTESVNEFMRNN